MGAVVEQFHLVVKAPYYYLRSIQYLLDTMSMSSAFKYIISFEY
jgi:hypothetical protein